MSLCPVELRSRYREGRLLPFVGAGASMSVSWIGAGGEVLTGPSWRQLVDQATEILGFQYPELARVRGSDLQILEYFKLKHGCETAKLTNWFSRRMNPPDDAIERSCIHAELARMERCRVFYTTNFDNFIERAFRLHGRSHVSIAQEVQMGLPREDCEIIKFHGDLDHPSNIVLTESDYEKRLSLSTHLDLRLRADLLGRVLLFVGYSFSDPNVSYLFRLFTDSFYDRKDGVRGPRAYILTPDPSDFERRLFQERKMEIVPIRGESMTEDIATILSEIRG